MNPDMASKSKLMVATCVAMKIPLSSWSARRPRESPRR
jgi:hypothetical protein